MKIILEIPETIIPDEIKTLIESGTSTENEHRRVVEAFLKLGLEYLDECEISVSQYKLVMK